MSRGGRILLEQVGPLPVAASDVEVRIDEPMARHTTLRLGGPADLWVMPRSLDALAKLLGFFDAAGVAQTFVGGGTNLLVRDAGIRGVVFNLGHLQNISRFDPDDPTRLVVETGVHTSKLLAVSVERSLQGLEFLAGVPGTVGGGLRMNAGTYLGEFTQVVTQVCSFARDGRRIVRDHAACGFVYRGSALPSEEIVAQTELRLVAGNPTEIASKIEELRARKRQREPKGVPNNGSTFKNPPGDFAGRIIESVGLKGYQIGGAQVSPVHANWLVVAEPATCRSTDLLQLIEHVRATVAARTGIELALEVRVIGDDVEGQSL